MFYSLEPDPFGFGSDPDQNDPDPGPNRHHNQASTFFPFYFFPVMLVYLVFISDPDQDDPDPSPILLMFFCSCFSSLGEMCA